MEFPELECLLANGATLAAVLGQHAADGKRISIMINSEAGNQRFALWQANMAGEETHYKVALQPIFQWENEHTVTYIYINQLHMRENGLYFQAGGISYLTVPIQPIQHIKCPQRHMAGQGPGETNSYTLTVQKKIMCFAELFFTSLYQSAR